MWHKFKKKYPVAYEVTQWLILALAVAALVINFIVVLTR